MNTRIAALVSIAALAALAGCSSSHASTAPGRALKTPAASPSTSAPSLTAQAIADRLKASGFTVTGPTKSADQGYIGQVGGVAWDLKISEDPGGAGINMFPNPEALKAWVPLSKSFGGVAVTGDTWALSLPSDSAAERTKSVAEAPKMAAALGGTVQK